MLVNADFRFIDRNLRELREQGIPIGRPSEKAACKAAFAGRSAAGRPWQRATHNRAAATAPMRFEDVRENRKAAEPA